MLLYVVERFLHEPMAREIGQPLPTLWTLNKLLHCIVLYCIALYFIVYQRKVDVDMLNAVNSMLANVSSVSPSSEQRANWTGQQPIRQSGRAISQDSGPPKKVLSSAYTQITVVLWTKIVVGFL